MYNEEYFSDIKFKTNWSPTKDFLVEAFEKLSSLAFSNRGWYYSDKELDSYLDTLDVNQVRYVWNSMPALRPGVLDLLSKRTKDGSDECKDIMKY